jgi:hypothetical protein
MAALRPHRTSEFDKTNELIFGGSHREDPQQGLSSPDGSDDGLCRPPDCGTIIPQDQHDQPRSRLFSGVRQQGPAGRDRASTSSAG